MKKRFWSFKIQIVRKNEEFLNRAWFVKWVRKTEEFSGLKVKCVEGELNLNASIWCSKHDQLNLPGFSWGQLCLIFKVLLWIES